MSTMIDHYRTLLDPEAVDQLVQISSLLKGIKIVHVNSTKEGGGVAEILQKMVPLTNELGLKAEWEVIKGDHEFFECTKRMHNLLQGRRGLLPTHSLLEKYEKINAQNAEALRSTLEDADIVIVHDPQPLALITHFPKRKGKWIWRCHIDLSNPVRELWKYLKNYVLEYDASIFSLEDFIHPLPHPMYLIPPSIDPLSEKNIDLPQSEIWAVHNRFGIDSKRPIILQVSRFDRFKDPLGVIRAYRMAKRFYPEIQLILAGGTATDDPEGAAIYEEVQYIAQEDPDIHALLLPPDAHRMINALQRGADIVLQKSIKEGFGLTVTEALWKMKPVIAGNTGGIRLQIIPYHTGFLVNTPEGAAFRIRYLLQNPQRQKELGEKGRKLVKENFLLTRQLRDHLTLIMTLKLPGQERLDLTERDLSATKIYSGLNFG